MHITFSPVRRNERPEITRKGDTITIDGVAFDFSPLPDGATLPQEAIGSDWFAGPVERSGGELRVTLVLSHGPNAPQETRFPAPITMTGDGPVPMPPYEVETDR
jgi:hypothetical protein